MTTFSVQPTESSQRETTRPPTWLEPMAWAWCGAGLVVVATVPWFWLISTPGTHVLVLAPFLVLFIIAAGTSLWTLVAWMFARHSDPPRRAPWPAAGVTVVLLLAVLGTRADVSVRARFAANRDELTALATGARPSSEAHTAPGFLRYGHLDVESVPGGSMIVTGGHPAANGFVYLPDPADAERWDGATSLRPLGGSWYLTV